MTIIRERASLIAYGLLAVVLFVLLPLTLDPFRLNLMGKYLAFAFVAIGIVLTWGYCGILSLGQGIFFGLGGYMMAMFLKLEASTPGLPDFMAWSGITALPLWWTPFQSIVLTVILVLVAPVALAFPFAYAIFKKRVGGVYFAIVTLALALTLTVLITGQQGATGGANGITDFRTLLGWDILSDQAKATLYFVEVALLFIGMWGCAFIIRSRLGKILVAIRDREDRVRFSGYDTAAVKAFVFAVAAMLSSVGGAMFVLQVGLISPGSIGVAASVEMVIYAAAGGRLSIPGAVVGAIVVGFAKSWLSEAFPEAWLFFLGALFLLVVMGMPNGLASLADRLMPRPLPRKG